MKPIGNKPVLFMKANVAGYTKKDGTTVAPHTDSRPPATQAQPAAKPAPAIGEWHLHKKHSDGTEEHRMVMSDGKPNFAGSGKKVRKLFLNPDGSASYASEHKYNFHGKSLDDLKTKTSHLADFKKPE